MHKNRYFYIGRTVVCLSEINPQEQADSTDLFQVSTKKATRTGNPAQDGRTARGKAANREKKNAECFVFLVPVVRETIPQEGKSDSIAVENVR